MTQSNEPVLKTPLKIDGTGFKIADANGRHVATLSSQVPMRVDAMIRRANTHDAILAKMEKLSRDVAAISSSTFDGNLECMATPSEMRDRASELIAAALAEIEEMK